MISTHPSKEPPHHDIRSREGVYEFVASLEGYNTECIDVFQKNNNSVQIVAAKWHLEVECALSPSRVLTRTYQADNSICPQASSYGKSIVVGCRRSRKYDRRDVMTGS